MRSVIRDPLVLGGVVGDVVDSYANSIPLTISYGSRVVTNGADFRTSAVSKAPVVQIGGNNFRSFYTLVMVNPDAPSPSNPTQKEYLHWMVSDIPETTNVNFGNELIPYESPHPTAGIHRMVFILFRQPARHLAEVGPSTREHFNTRTFATSHSLGTPAAMMFYNCQRERGTGGRRFM